MTKKDSTKDNDYKTLALVFAITGFIQMIIEATRITGFVFLVLAIVFYILSQSKSKK